MGTDAILGFENGAAATLATEFVVWFGWIVGVVVLNPTLALE